MPSAHKTGHLSLNKWIGTDKPKKDDFNQDNDKIDAACRSLSAEVGAAQEAAEASRQGVSELEARCGRLETSYEDAAGALSAHVGDAVLHCTAAEKALWNGGAVVVGTYTGNGGMSQQVAMGFRPRFGVLYAVGESPVQADWNHDETDIYFGFFSTSGCSRFIALTDTGITVNHNYTVPVNGCSLLYNESGVTYVYLAWK